MQLMTNGQVLRDSFMHLHPSAWHARLVGGAQFMLAWPELSEEERRFWETLAQSVIANELARQNERWP